MDRRKAVIFWICIGVALAAGCLALVQWRNALVRQELALWRQAVETSSPARRLEAAEQVLRLDRRDRQTVLIKAQTLIELRSFAKARETLAAEHWTDPALATQAMLLRARSYLAEAQQAIEQVGRGGAHLLEQRVEPLLGEALAIRRMLLGQATLEGPLTALEAQALDVRVRMLRAQLRELDVELSKASAVEAQEQAHGVGIQIGDLRAHLEALEEQLENLCRTRLSQDPANAELWGVLFELLFRKNRFNEASQAAQTLAQSPEPITCELAGRVAGLLLDQEWLVGRPCRRTDLELAEQILQHRGLTGHPTIDYRLALGELALARQNWSDVERLARVTLTNFEGHPQALRQLALALARQNQTQAAIDLLVPVVEMVRDARLCHALGQIYRLAGQKKAAQDLWRQALDIDPTAVVPRLALAQAMVEDGFTLEAGPDILVTWRSYPEHPQALALYTRLLAWKLDLNGLAELLSKPGKVGDQVSWRHAAMAAWMALDEPRPVAQLAQEALEADPTDVQALLARAWLECPAGHRWQLPSLAAWLVLEELESNPLATVHAGPTVSWLHQAGQLESVEPSSLSQIVSTALEGMFERSWLLPGPEEVSLRLLDLALDRWPNQPWLLRAHAITAVRLEQPQMARQSLARLGSLHANDATVQALSDYLNGDLQRLSQTLNRTESDVQDSLAAWLRLSLALDGADLSAAMTELEKSLQTRTWDQTLVQAFMRRTIAKNDWNTVHQGLQRLRRINSQLAQLTAARLALHQRRITEALQEVELLLAREPGGSELRCQAAEPRVLIHLAENHLRLATGVLENLAISAPRRKHQMQAAAMEILLTAGRRTLALAMLSQLLGEGDLPAGWLDRLLNRAIQIMGLPSFLRLLEEIPDERSRLDSEQRRTLLDFYRAVALARSGRLDQAEQIFQRLEQVQPGAPRLILEQARLAMRHGRVDVARQLYQRLIAMGGSARQAAWQDLEEHGLAPGPPPVGNRE